MSEHNWNEPVRWNRAAGKVGERRRVFPSMCDPFEDRPDLDEPRLRMFKLIDATPHLDWLLLTKRPENIRRMWPTPMAGNNGAGLPAGRKNVWLMTSVEDQKNASARIPELLRCADLAPVLGLSVEPLIGPVNLKSYLANNHTTRCPGSDAASMGIVNWVVCGGESGHDARPMLPAWAISVRDQCLAAGTPFLFKQWGEYGPGFIQSSSGGRPEYRCFRQFESHQQWVNKASSWINGGECFDANGKPCRIGLHFQEAQYPVTIMHKLGKKNAGRLLDGVEWSEYPKDVKNESSIAK